MMPRKALRRPNRTATADLFVRGIPRTYATAISRGAHSRSLTLGEYLVRLALLHAAVREAASDGDGRAASILATLGLETVTV